MQFRRLSGYYLSSAGCHCSQTPRLCVVWWLFAAARRCAQWGRWRTVWSRSRTARPGRGPDCFSSSASSRAAAALPQQHRSPSQPPPLRGRVQRQRRHTCRAWRSDSQRRHAGGRQAVARRRAAAGRLARLRQSCEREASARRTAPARRTEMPWPRRATPLRSRQARPRGEWASVTQAVFPQLGNTAAARSQLFLARPIRATTGGMTRGVDTARPPPPSRPSSSSSFYRRRRRRWSARVGAPRRISPVEQQ